MALFDVIGELYDPNADVKPRFLVNQGGTSSGKTYTIMQRLIVLSFEHPMAIITVCGQDLPNLKVGAMRDLDTILHTRAELLDWFKNNKSDSSYRGKNGSIIEFKSYQDAQDAKNGKRDYLFVNEANGVPYEVFWQLAIRTRKQVFIDYNPSARFWVHNNIIGRDDCRLILSDHRNNRFLTEQEHKKIEEIDDPELWRVYARGLTGKITGLIFTNWGIVDKLPPREEWKMECTIPRRRLLPHAARPIHAKRHNTSRAASLCPTTWKKFCCKPFVAEVSGLRNAQQDKHYTYLYKRIRHVSYK